MERAAENRQALQVIWRGGQTRAGPPRGVDHLTRFLEEHLAHLVVVRGVIGIDIAWRRRGRLKADRLRRRVNEVGQRLGQLIARRVDGSRIACGFKRDPRLVDGGSQRRLIGSSRLLRQALQIACHSVDRDVVASCVEGQHLCLLDESRLGRGGHRFTRHHRRAVASAHHRRQRAGIGVEDKQRLRQGRLHAEHVDQESERTQVASQAIEDTGLAHARQIDLG